MSAFSAGRLKCCSRLSRLSQEMAVRDRHSSRVWPGCSLSGCGPKPVRFFCRSSEMLLASLAAITRNGCARSAFQPRRSEEHTSELQSRLHLVCRLLLEKKKHD